MNFFKRIILRLTTTNVVTCFKCADKVGDAEKINFAIYQAIPLVTYTCPECGKQWIKQEIVSTREC